MVLYNDALERCVISEGGTLRDALASLDRSSSKVVVVVDASDHVIGLLTDGDLRRALLAGAALSDPIGPHLQRRFTFVGRGASRADVLDLMHARQISVVPILDDGRLVGLHLMHDVLAPKKRENWAVIMAGGRGTRLAPLTDNVPKPMLRVAGRPILERIVLHLVGAGITRIYIAINYLGHVVEEHFEHGERFGCRIDYLKEEQPLGTAGALSLLPERPTAPLLVMNGDLVTQMSFGDMLSTHESAGNAITVGVRRYLHNVPFGCVVLEGDRIVGIEEKPTLSQAINAGIYVMQPSVLDRLSTPRELAMPDLLNEVMKRETVGAYEIVDEWADIGQKDQLNRARGTAT